MQLVIVPLQTFQHYTRKIVLSARLFQMILFLYSMKLALFSRATCCCMRPATLFPERHFFRCQSGSEINDSRLTENAWRVWMNALALCKAMFNKFDELCWAKSMILKTNLKKLDSSTILISLYSSSKFCINYMFGLNNVAIGQW